MILRRHQEAARDAVYDSFRAGLMRVLLHMCVASGKSLTIAEITRVANMLGWRVLILSHVRELVEQVATALAVLKLPVGINAASLHQRVWRGQNIVAAIQSVYNNGRSFGPIDLLIIDECHLIPFGEMGMYRQIIRDLGVQRIVGLTGTPFRLQGGRLDQGEGALFEKTVYNYSLLDGIYDKYLVQPLSVTVDDKIDASGLKVSKGEFTGSSQDAQMLALMNSHVAQMRVIGADRKRWLIFEASTKAAKAMTARMNEWGIPTGLVLGTTPHAERTATIAAYRAGRLRALVNVAALTTGFDVQEVDLVVMRRKTMSLGLFIQMLGRGMRTVGGNLESSIAAGKADCLILDYADNIGTHGPIDLIRPKETISKLVSCDACRARVPAAAMKCWACDEPMTKNCPACLQPIQKGLLDCPLCGHDMRVGGGDEDAAPKGQKLLERPSGAALIASYKPGAAREGGWLPVRRVWEQDDVVTLATESGQVTLPEAFAAYGKAARWIRLSAEGAVDAVLIPNGSSRTSVLQVTVGAAGVVQLPVPMPSPVADAA